jgi:hypothetical protein
MLVLPVIPATPEVEAGRWRFQSQPRLSKNYELLYKKKNKVQIKAEGMAQEKGRSLVLGHQRVY